MQRLTFTIQTSKVLQNNRDVCDFSDCSKVKSCLSVINLSDLKV